MTPPTRPRRFLTGVALALLLTAGAAACGASGDSEGGTDTTTTTRADRTTTTASTTTTEEETTTTEDESTTTPSEGTPPTEDGTTTTTTDGEPSSDPQDYVDALVAEFEEDGGDQIFESGQVECLAERFVDVVGIDELQAAGVSPDEFAEGDGSEFPAELGVDEDKANELYDQFAACEIDLRELLTKVFTSEGNEITAEQQACLDKVFTDENLRATVVADFLGDELENDPLDAAGECVDLGSPDGSPDGPADTVDPGGN